MNSLSLKLEKALQYVWAHAALHGVEEKIDRKRSVQETRFELNLVF